MKNIYYLCWAWQLCIILIYSTTRLVLPVGEHTHLEYLFTGTLKKLLFTGDGVLLQVRLMDSLN